MANKGLDRKAAAVGVEGKRMLILDQEKCKPMMPAHDFLKRIARSCGRDCITIDESKKIQILEDACLACLNRAPHPSPTPELHRPPQPWPGTA
jgi:hypothetical protein